MQIAPLPTNERERLISLYALNILDTPPEERYDRITRLAKRVLDMPIVLISLVDRQRQWFKSSQGLDTLETGRDVSFCAHAIHELKTLIVADASVDERFSDNPLVAGAPYIRFYAGHPIAAPDGQLVGTLCVIDRESRTLSEDDLLCLQDLALMVENELGLTLLAERNQEYTNRLEETISQRTLELLEKNRQLEQQHADRLRIQKTLTSVFETVREGLLVIDGSGSVVLANAEARNIWQYESESLVDQNIATLVQGFDNGSSLDLHNRSQQGFHGSIIDPSAERERPRSMVDRFKSVGVRKNGSTFPLDISIAETVTDGSVLYTVAVRDISEQQKLDKLRDAFVANVSHELRTPLTSIMGYLETILSERPGPLTELQQRFLQRARGSSERLKALVEEILLVGRLREEDIELHVQPVSVSNLLAGVIEKMGATEAAQNLTVRIQNEWPEEQMPLVDEFRITQVIENLVSNAIKFTVGVGSVTIHTQPEGSDWSVKVTDTGIGMAEADLARVFQRFFRGDNAMAQEIQGTGLGLSICEAIIDAHGGEMGVDSTLGVGTTVWFKIPVQTVGTGENSGE